MKRRRRRWKVDRDDRGVSQGGSGRHAL